jgi:hypothetical protein
MHFTPRQVLSTDPADPDTRETFLERLNGLPPLIGGYRVVSHFGGSIVHNASIYDLPRHDDTYDRREGYFAIAGTICLHLDGRGHLSGVEQFNRGGVGVLLTNDIRGTYEAHVETGLGVAMGELHTIHRNTGDDMVQNDYAFFVRNDDELEWVAKWSYVVGDDPMDFSKHYRRRVANGTFRRVTSTMTGLTTR